MYKRFIVESEMCQSKTSVLKLKVNTTSYETLVAG